MILLDLIKRKANSISMIILSNTNFKKTVISEIKAIQILVNPLVNLINLNKILSETNQNHLMAKELTTKLNLQILPKNLSRTNLTKIDKAFKCQHLILIKIKQIKI